MTHLNFAMTTLLNGIWQGALLAAAMWVILKLFPRVNPTTRFTLLWLTSFAVVMLPIGPLALTVPRTDLWPASGTIASSQYGCGNDIHARGGSPARTCARVKVWIEFGIPT